MLTQVLASERSMVTGKGESKVMTTAASLWPKQLSRSGESVVSTGESGVKEALVWGSYPLLKALNTFPFQNIKGETIVTFRHPSWTAFTEHRAITSLALSVSDISFLQEGCLQEPLILFTELIG